jgi:hypothetical protein
LKKRELRQPKLPADRVVTEGRDETTVTVTEAGVATGIEVVIGAEEVAHRGGHVSGPPDRAATLERSAGDIAIFPRQL